MATVIVFTDNNARIIQNPDDLNQYRNNPNAVIDPDLSEVVGTPPHLWKLLDGKVVRMQKYEEAQRVAHIETHGAVNTIVPVKVSIIKKIIYRIRQIIIKTLGSISCVVKSISIAIGRIVNTIKIVSSVLSRIPMKILDFCNVLDYNKKLSITNIALIALLGKMLLAPNIDWPSLVAVIVAFSNYAHKRAVSSNAENE